MDIRCLSFFVSDTELTQLARRFQPADAPVKNLTVRVTPEGVRVCGEATVMMTVPFESLWQPKVVEGRVAVQLVSLSAAGFPATVFRSLVLGILKDAVKEPFIAASDEAIVVDVQDFVKRQRSPVELRFEMQAVRCVEGGAVVEAGWPAVGAPRATSPAS